MKILGTTSTIQIPVSIYDINENFPKLLEDNQSFTENCFIKINNKDHLIKIKFISDPLGKDYIKEVSK